MFSRLLRQLLFIAHVLLALSTTTASNGDRLKLAVMIREGAHDDVLTLLDSGSVSVNEVFSKKTGTTPLILAVELEQETIVRLLLERGAEVNQVDIQHVTALWLASGQGHLEIVRLLLEANANPNIASEEGLTPLHAAVIFNHTEIVQLLLFSGADPDAQDDEGHTAIFDAAENNYPALLKILHSVGADLELTVTEKNGTGTAVDVAAHFDHVEALKMLHTLEAKFTNAHIMTAALEGNFRTMKYLSELGLDVNAVDERGSTALHVAAGSSDLTSVQTLLTLGSNVNAVDASGWTPLHSAAAHGGAMIVQTLIDNGADPYIKDHDETLPLTLAKMQKFHEVVKILENVPEKFQDERVEL